MVEPYTAKVKMNLKKVQGQINLIQRMIDEDKYCVNVAQQVNSAIGLLRQVNNYIMESHILCCGVEKLKSKDQGPKIEFAKELIKTFGIASNK